MISIEMDKLKATIASVLDIPADRLGEDSSGRTVAQWDSIAHMNVVLALEQRFNISFTLDEIMAMRNVEAIRTIVESKLS
jgi:acyl carrier protein